MNALDPVLVAVLRRVPGHNAEVIASDLTARCMMRQLQFLLKV